MNYKTIIGSLALVTLLSACSTPPPEVVAPVVIKREPLPRPALNLPAVDRIDAQQVEWVIVTPENFTEIFAAMTARGDAPALFALTEQGYENLAINTQETLRVIIQQQAVIDGYQVYYIRADTTIADFNSSQ